MSEEISVQIETNEVSKKIDPYCSATTALISRKLETVDHVPRDVSRHFLLEKREGV